MPDWAILVIGLVLLGLAASDRASIRSAWRRPARWWSRDPKEAFNSRSPAQPLNVVLGVVLGSAAVIYGVVALLH